jgi:hypothetical protein
MQQQKVLSFRLHLKAKFSKLVKVLLLEGVINFMWQYTKVDDDLRITWRLLLFVVVFEIGSPR